MYFTFLYVSFTLFLCFTQFTDGMYQDRLQNNRHENIRIAYCVCYVLYWLMTQLHWNDVTISTKASQITVVSINWSNVCSDTNQRKHQTPCHRPSWGESTQMTTTAENVSIWWRHHICAVRILNHGHRLRCCACCVVSHMICITLALEQ